MVSSDMLISMLKEREGFQLRLEWVQEWLAASQYTNTESAYRALRMHVLDHDLHDTSLPVIQDSYGEEPLMVFPDRQLVLQIQDTIDIGVSTHSLLNQLATVTPVKQVYIRRQSNEQIQFQRSLLRWTLTDGHKLIQATELTPIPELDLKTPFGCKLLLTKCKVRRGMLLLTKDSVKVLGGHVPDLYGGNMIVELERRFKQRLGLPIESSLGAQDDPITLQGNDEIDMDDSFDLDDDAIEQLQVLEMEAIQANSSSQRGLDSTPLEQPTTPNSFPSFDSPPPLFSPSPPSHYIDPNIIPPDVTMETIDDTPAPQHAPLHSTHFTSETETFASTGHKKPTPPNSHLLDSSPATAVKPLPSDLDWIDPTVWETMDEDKLVKVKIEASQSTPSLPTVERLYDILNAMQHNQPCHYDSDHITIEGQCQRLANMKLTSSRGFYLVARLEAPPDKSVHVVFGNKLVTTLIGVSHLDVIKMSKEQGQGYIARKYFKPFQDKLCSSAARFELDLSLVEKHSDGTLMPEVMSFHPDDSDRSGNSIHS